MAGELDKAMEAIGDMLNSDGAAEKISNLMSSFSGSGSSPSSPPSPSAGVSDDMIHKIKGVYDTFNQRDDQRLVLLSALRPYVSSSRGHKIDSAIKMMQLFKVIQLMGPDFKKLF